MNILFVSRVTLPPGERGNAQYTLCILDQLRRLGHEVRVVVTEGVVATPSMWDMPPTAEEREYVAEQVRALRPDMLMVNYTYLCSLLPLAPAGCATCVLTHDARHLRYADFQAKNHVFESSPWTEADERGALAHAERIIAIQPEEEYEFQRVAPHAKTITVPCSFFPHRLPHPEKPDSCLFIGSDADHNLYGMQWFLDQVWPGVLRETPDASLDICGTVNVRLRTSLPGTTLHGRVEDLEAMFRRCAVGIVPLLAGSGCKIKLVETLSRGRVCVSTPVGVAGMEHQTEGIVVADSAEAFARALVELFRDAGQQRRRAESAYRYACERFHPDGTLEPLQAFLSV